MKRTHHMPAGALITLGLTLPFAAEATQGFGFDRGAQTGYFEINVGESEWDAAALDSFSSVGGPLTSTSLDKNGIPRGHQRGL